MFFVFLFQEAEALGRRGLSSHRVKTRGDTGSHSSNPPPSSPPGSTLPRIGASFDITNSAQAQWPTTENCYRTYRNPSALEGRPRYKRSCRPAGTLLEYHSAIAPGLPRRRNLCSSFPEQTANWSCAQTTNAVWSQDSSRYQDWRRRGVWVWFSRGFAASHLRRISWRKEEHVFVDFYWETFEHPQFLFLIHFLRVDSLEYLGKWK